MRLRSTLQYTTPTAFIRDLSGLSGFTALRSRFNDNNCCTVLALSAVTGMDFAQAQRIGFAAGRRRNKGFYTHVLVDFFNRQTDGKKFAPISPFTLASRARTIGQFVKSFPVGRYMVQISRHAFAVVDGIPVDFVVRPKARIRRVWAFGDSALNPAGVVVSEKRSRSTSSESTKDVVFDRERFIAEYYATGKPSSKKIPCSVTGKMVTMFGSNLHNRVKKFGSVERLLAEFRCRDWARVTINQHAA